MSQERMRRLQELPRLRGEAETIRAMVRLYCRAHHPAERRVKEVGSEDVCPDCRDFLNYALKRLACCPFGVDKPVCAKCRIHCYKPAEREKARAIMRWAGPRLLWHHPIMALRHVRDNLRKAPEKPRNRAKPATASSQPAAPRSPQAAAPNTSSSDTDR